METKLPSIEPENTIFIPSSNKIPRQPLLSYVSVAALRLEQDKVFGGKEVIYFSGTGEATSRVVDASEILKRYCPDAHVVFVGIGTCRIPRSKTEKFSREISNLVIGLSKKNYYKPVFDFLPDTYFERSISSF